jgi:hypothetical protein
MKRHIILTVAIVIIFALIPESAVSQTAEGNLVPNPQAAQEPSSGAQEPVVIQKESESPWYYYWPQENLDPFSMSTLEKDSGSFSSGVGSTLGKGSNRPSNLEVNPPLKSGQTEDITTYDEQEIIAPPIHSPPEGGIDDQFAPEIDANLSPIEGAGKIYKWVDKNGVLNITNELNKVPPEYRNEEGGNPEDIEAQ